MASVNVSWSSTVPSIDNDLEGHKFQNMATTGQIRSRTQMRRTVLLSYNSLAPLAVLRGDCKSLFHTQNVCSHSLPAHGVICTSLRFSGVGKYD